MHTKRLAIMTDAVASKRLALLASALAIVVLTISCTNPTPSVGPTDGARLGSIPGLTGPHAVAFLSEQGFSCSEPTTSPQYAAVWNCARGQAGGGYLQVEVAGDSQSAIQRITVALSGPSTGINNMRSSFADIATVPYDGAQPAAAKSWVEQNFDRGAQTRIAGVAFVLAPQTSGTKAMRIGVN
jgi:hypothetical protein